MRPSKFLALLALAITPLGCIPENGLALDLEGESLRSFILYVPDQIDSKLFAFDLDALASGLPLGAHGTEGIQLLGYPETLEELVLSSGELFSGRAPQSCAPEFVRTLPIPTRLWSLQNGAAEKAAITESFRQALSEVGLPNFDLNQCAALQGCLVNENDGPRCKIPCGVEPPMPPMPPASPAWPSWLPPIAPDEPAIFQRLSELDNLKAFNRPRDCIPPESAALPELDCVRFGGDCPKDEWPQDIPAGAPTVFVSPGAQGNGTQDAPFGTIEAALAGAPDGAIIVLSKGDHLGPVLLNRPLSLLGACAETRLVLPPNRPAAAALTIDGTTTRISNLTIETGDTRALFIGGGAEVTLEQLVLKPAPHANGLEASSSQVTAERLLIQGGNIGVDITLDAALRLNNSVIEGASALGVRCSNGELLQIDQTVIAHNDGAGVLAMNCRSSIHRSLIDDNRLQGVLWDDVSMTKDLNHHIEDTVITRTRALELQGGDGLFVNTATGTLNRVIVHDNAQAGVRVLSGLLDASDLSGTTTGAEILMDVALSTLLLQRAALEGGRLALRISNSSNARIMDITLQGGDESSLEIDTSDVTAERVFVIETPIRGIDLINPLTISLQDIKLNGGDFGLSLRQRVNESLITLKRVEISKPNLDGLHLRGGQSVITDLKVQDSGRVGVSISRGLDTLTPLSVSLDRFILEGNEIGLLNTSDHHPQLSDGQLVSNEVGVKVAICPSETALVFEGLQFEKNKTGVVFEEE